MCTTSSTGMLTATSLNEQGIREQVCSTDRSKESSNHVRLSMEMAVEGAHLGGTEHQVHEVTVRL